MYTDPQTPQNFGKCRLDPQTQGNLKFDFGRFFLNSLESNFSKEIEVKKAKSLRCSSLLCILFYKFPHT